MDECVLYRPQYLHVNFGDVIETKALLRMCIPARALCVCVLGYGDLSIHGWELARNGPTRGSNETHTNFATSSKALEERERMVPSFPFQYRPLNVCGHVASWLTVINIRLTCSNSCMYLDTDITFVHVAMWWSLPTSRANMVIGSMHGLCHSVNNCGSLSKWDTYCHSTQNQS